jgi:hypothetical protein
MLNQVSKLQEMPVEGLPHYLSAASVSSPSSVSPEVSFSW